MSAIGQPAQPPAMRIPQTVDELPGKRPQHPLYKTASQEYGKGVADVKAPVRSGRKGCFTKEFVGGPVRDCGLNVSVDKSRVSKNPGPLGAGPSTLL
eukprot:TRINITY_DN2397_c1_g1_i1.p1 TRINITY_DN2397_c1_g1~~TRINITY_DN2397_c1_g1_i1.p1  ORF type:complete len:114 (+),score=22.12 TRINITY_DN2397_c1_g1_i1:54-344(+)